MLLHLLVRQIKNHKFGHVLQKKCYKKVKRPYFLHTMSKKKRIIYQKNQLENSHPILTAIGLFANFLESSNSERKKRYGQISVFLKFC